jgi:hypothetical protein
MVKFLEKYCSRCAVIQDSLFSNKNVLFWNLANAYNSVTSKEHCLLSFEIFQGNLPSGAKMLSISNKAGYPKIEDEELHKKVWN